MIKNAVNEDGTVLTPLPAGCSASNGATVHGAWMSALPAGPAGISASLRAIEKKLTYVTLEQDEFGGTVAKYPRQKLVMTSPVEFPIYGKFNKLQISKEEIIKFWQKLHGRAGLQVNTHEKVDAIRKEPDGAFSIETTKGRYRAWTVVLALGRCGTPRKLGVPGEGLPKVMYGLIEAEAYTDAKILVVGGGDSAVEAAMGLAHQRGKRVTLSYRGTRSAASRSETSAPARITKGGRRKSSSTHSLWRSASEV
jgi:thioredoxin reductase